MPFDWEPQIREDEATAFKVLRPKEMLYELDNEPLLFVTTTAQGLNVLCYKTDNDDIYSQYIVSPTNDSIINRLIKGNISLRSAIFQPWLWVAEVANSDFSVRVTWTLSPDSLPEAVLPKTGRSLYSSGSIILEKTVVREKEAYLSVKFRGGDIKNGTIPFGVIKNSLDEVYRSVWGIFSSGIKKATHNVNESILRRIVNIPTYEMAHASLLIEIERPEIDLSVIRSNNIPDINVEHALLNVDAAHKDFLDSTQIIRKTLQDGEITEGLAENNFDAIEAVAPIVPRQNSFFEAIEINGRHPDRVMRPLIINVAQGNAIREVYENAKLSLRTIEGEIFLVNSHSYQFTIAAGAKNVTCVATTDEQRARISTLQSGDRAVVRGYLTHRVQRDLMQIQTLMVNGLTTA
ncbi:MAG TPA: hypothetical protein VHW66_20885 [Stellaceae bacterium]|jgi:hypothetical protein|nr:hypothetical protein [Stellaceae bacterium]